MAIIDEIKVEGYEKVIRGIDSRTGLRCFIAIHNTALGPAMGGTRIYPYATEEEALQDVLRLAKGMTYKNAMAELGLGGGKAVIIADPRKDKSAQLLLSYGDVVDTLKGKYITAEDVGTNTHDMSIVRNRTRYVAALPHEKSSGDPSRFTAWGVFRGMKAIAQFLWSSPSLAGKTVAIQGLGNVGAKLAHLLFWEGADLILCDTNNRTTHEVARTYGAKVVSPADILGVECDILSPCAMGDIFTETTLPRLRCQAIAGSANNQLHTPKIGEELFLKGIIYAPDYVINAGGIINAVTEFDAGGYNPNKARDRVNQIYDHLLFLFMTSKQKHKAVNLVADEIVEQKLAKQIGRRDHPILF